jgi:hypothetical protein
MAEGEVMRKQILKGATMFLGVMTLAMVAAVVSANGQSVNARGKVPFDFVVGDKTLSSGAYTINSLTDHGCLRIRNINSGSTAVTQTTGSGGRAKQAKMVFHRYGQRYFLAEVWTSSENGQTLATSKEERAIRKELSRIASNKPAQRGYETLEVAITAQ